MSKKVFSLVLLLSFISCGSIKNLKKESDLFETEFEQETFSIEKRDVLNKSVNGNWQLRISGNPFEIGYKKGFLTQQLYQNQEKIFFGKVSEMIPNPSKQNKLLYFLKWYNRNILSAIPMDLKQELYAVSTFGSDEFNDIGTKFERNLLLHSSHDIGHAMQDLMLVGCSSIALWDNFTEDGNLLI
ncbi:MAG: acyl-CoA--6-aminopenicillanic acid acyl-transferase, partial [Myroides sp.]